MSEFVEHEVEVVLLVTTTREDAQQALIRSGITPGAVIGEALILSTAVYSPEAEDSQPQPREQNR